MKILDEPISTWIAIAAFLISFSTLLLAMRKQKHDERTMLAGKVAEIRMLYVEAARAVDELIKKHSGLENAVKDSPLARETSEGASILSALGEYRSSLEELGVQLDGTFKKYGYERIRVTDPVILSAVAVSMDDVRKQLEVIRSDTEKFALAIETTIKDKSEKPASRKVQNKKPLRKKGVKAKKS